MQDENYLKKLLKELFELFNNYNCMYLRHKSVPGYKSSIEMQNRVAGFYKDKEKVDA